MRQIEKRAARMAKDRIVYLALAPTYQGPKKPPRLPSELIQAIAPAAAVPVRNIGGIAQNGPFGRLAAIGPKS
jgi:thiamine monophosphate synthase